MTRAKHVPKSDHDKSYLPALLTKVAAQAKMDRTKPNKEEQKNNYKAIYKVEAAKPPQRHARELRSVAAKALFLCNQCAGFRKFLKFVTFFLSLKYCSTACVNNHRKKLIRCKRSNFHSLIVWRRFDTATTCVFEPF